MKCRSCFVLVTAALVPGILLVAWEPTVAQDHKEPKIHEYVLEVEGTAGVQLDMLLITKPSAEEGPNRETARITVP